MHNIQSSALKPPSSKITCATLSLNSKCLNYAASMCIVRYRRIEPLIPRLWKCSTKPVNLVPHPCSQWGSADFSDRIHFSITIPWYWKFVCNKRSCSYRALVLNSLYKHCFPVTYDQTETKRKKKNKERRTCRTYPNFIKVVLVMGILIAEWSSLNCVVSRTWSMYKLVLIIVYIAVQ